jgi:hypothetical protein
LFEVVEPVQPGHLGPSLLFLPASLAEREEHSDDDQGREHLEHLPSSFDFVEIECWCCVLRAAFAAYQPALPPFGPPSAMKIPMMIASSISHLVRLSFCVLLRLPALRERLTVDGYSSRRAICMAAPRLLV